MPIVGDCMQPSACTARGSCPHQARDALAREEVPQRLRAGLGVARRPRAARGRCAPPSSARSRPASPAGTRRLRLQFLAHRAGRQEGQAVAFERHRLQAFGHVGFVDRVEVAAAAALLEDLLDQARPCRRPRRSSGRAAAAPARAGQAEQRLAVGVGLGVGRQRLAGPGSASRSGRASAAAAATGGGRRSAGRSCPRSGASPRRARSARSAGSSSRRSARAASISQCGKKVKASVCGTANSIMSCPLTWWPRIMLRVACRRRSISSACAWKVSPAGVRRVG